MSLSIGLGMRLATSGGGAPTLPSTNLIIDYDVANAALVLGNVDTLDNAGSLSTDANTNLTYDTDRPIYTASDADFNSKPSAGASSDSRGLASGTFAAAISQPSTWYLVCKVTYDTSTVFWRLGAGGSFADSAGLSVAVDGTTTVTSNATALSASIAEGVHLLAVVYNGASSALYVDDMTTAVASGDADSSSCAAFYSGTYSGQPGTYKWARHLAYSTAHDATARAAVAAYLSAEYGL